MLSERRILVIGAGASGLAAIKSCKEESLDVYCYEKTANFGGRWRYRDDSASGLASIMKSTVCKYSKEMGAFSDFPPPTLFPNYLQHRKMLKYLTFYAQKFDLLRHITYETEVTKITPSEEYEENGKWRVISKNIVNEERVTEEFDGIMICTGRLSEPSIPCFPDQDLFTGSIQHSQSIKTRRPFEDLKVLIVGNGNSGVDTAVELSFAAQQVYLSTRNGFWIFPKVGSRGKPYDLELLRRDKHFLKTICSDVANYYVERVLERRMNHEAYSIKPSYKPMEKPPTFNDELPERILTRRIIIKDQISKFEKHGVVFNHENDVTDIDCVIFATGYEMKFSFIDRDIYMKNGISNLYKYVFPVKLKHPSLAFIGFVESNGPQIPVSESQTRWVSRVFAKKTAFATRETVEKYIVSLSSKQNSMDLTVDFIDYMDELAEKYGVKPNIRSLIWQDISLFWACFTGPFLPYQYRLVGPNHLNNARELILESGKRVDRALNGRALGKPSADGLTICGA